MQIENNRVVFIRYLMKNQAGEILEDTLSRDPIGFLQGSATIHSDLQKQLNGYKVGDKPRVSLTLSAHEDFVFDVIIDAVREATEAEIMLGYPLQAAQKCEEDCECYED